VNRWYATRNPQHMLPGSADVLAFGTARRVDSEQISKPAPGEAPPSA
jgi:hypothetical protein